MQTKRPLATILKPDVQKIFDHFSSCFNIRMLFYSSAGEMLNVGLNRPDSPYCKLIQRRLLGENACLAMDQAKRDEAARTGSMICYTCHAGLVETIVPIYSEKKLLGFVAIGQFRSTEEIPQGIADYWQSKCGSAELAEAYAGLPCVPREQIDHILGLFSVLVDYIVSQRMVAIRGSQLIDDVISYIESNIDKDISLPEVAALVGRSQSTISHLFMEKIGKSFKRVLVETRLKKADMMMLEEPGIAIKEVSTRVGYSDSLYFSKIYKQYRGESPSKVRARARLSD